jgi:hypothetical protein
MKIIDMQDYTSASNIYMAVKRTVGGQDLEVVSLSSSGKDVQDIEEFISKGFIKAVKTSFESDINFDISDLRTLHDVLNFLDDKLHNVDIPMSFKFQDMSSVLKSLDKHLSIDPMIKLREMESFQLDLVIDQQGFEVLTYKPRNRENISKVKEEMIKLGFPLTACDNDRWELFEQSRSE